MGDHEAPLGQAGQVGRFPQFLDAEPTVLDTVEAQPDDTAEAQRFGMSSSSTTVVRNFLSDIPPEQIAALIPIILCSGCQKSSQASDFRIS